MKKSNGHQFNLFGDTVEKRPVTKFRTFQARPVECGNCGLYPDGRLRCVLDLLVCPPEDHRCSDYSVGVFKVIELGWRRGQGVPKEEESP